MDFLPRNGWPRWIATTHRSLSMLGRETRLPVELMLGNGLLTNYGEYIEKRETTNGENQ